MASITRAELGILFDWDGVIIDSSSQHETAWEKLAREEHRVLPANHFKLGFGMKNEPIIPQILRWTDLPAEIERLSLRKEALYCDTIRERGIEPLAGVREFLTRLVEGGIPFAVGSSTHRLNIETILDVIGLRSHFSAIVSADDVTQGKPHPDVFLRGAQRLGKRPDHCVVFEDALVGIEAAHAGGMKVVGVAATHSAEELSLRVHRVVRRLDELSIEDLLALWS